MANKRLRIFHEGTEITDRTELRNGKANPFGWSQHEVWAPNGLLGMERIGWLESGAPMDFIDGFTFTVEDIPEGEPLYYEDGYVQPNRAAPPTV